MYRTKFTYLIVLSCLISLLFSCSVQQDVISEKKFQKRKYQKGLFIQKKHKKAKRFEIETKEKDIEIHTKEGKLFSSLRLELNRTGLKGQRIQLTKVIEPKEFSKQIHTREDISSTLELESTLYVPHSEEPPLNVAGLVGFICLLLSLASFVLGSGLGILFLLGALVLGLIGRAESQEHKRGRYYAQVAVYGAIVIMILWLLALLLFISWFGGSLIPFIIGIAAIIILSFFLL